jgi:hypothetical protein
MHDPHDSNDCDESPGMCFVILVFWFQFHQQTKETNQEREWLRDFRVTFLLVAKTCFYSTLRVYFQSSDCLVYG